MKFLDLFAGIGGFRLGMEAAGHECVGFCEIDKFARESYKAIHDTKGEIELHDITAVSDDTVRGIGHVDVICGGFPCQAFSIAGKRKGFEDTRGTLFFEIARFATLDELGYDAEWQVLNSKNFGVPQNRERVFIIGHLRGECTRRVFPLSRENQSISNQSVVKIGNVNPSGNGMNGEVYQADGLAPSLTTNKGEGQKIAIPVLTPDRTDKRQNGRRFKSDGEPMFTLTAQDKHGIMIREATSQGYAEAEIGDSVNLAHPNSKTRRGRVGKGQANTLLTGESQGVVTPDFRIRKLTPRECWRLQGFPDWAFDRAQEVNSNSQLYKQAGNSVTVNVIAAIAKELK